MPAVDVLNDLWEVDPSLNDGITELGVDLSGTSLPESEQAAVAYAFGSAHGLMAMEGTYQDFVDSGYIDGEALFWKDGCLFSVKETQDENPVTFNLPSFGPGDEMPDYSGVRFDAEKWRSGLGAYFFTDCTAVRNGGGQWAGAGTCGKTRSTRDHFTRHRRVNPAGAGERRDKHYYRHWR